MPTETMQQMYTKLFGANNAADAQRKTEEHVRELVEMRRREFAQFDEEEAQERFEARYYNFCEKWLKNAWTRNLRLRLHGENVTRNSEQVTDEFAEYMEGVNALLRSSGIGNAPNVGEILEEGLTQSEQDGVTTDWKREWQREVLQNAPHDKIGVEQEVLYGRDPRTGNEPSVKEAVNRACEEVEGFCRDISEENRAEKCVEAAIRLRAVEQKRASRGILWKIFHPINNYRERKAVERMQNAIGQRFTPEEIAAVSGEALRVAWLDEERGEGILPHAMNELKVDALESEEQTRQRVAAETAETAREKEELARIAEDLKPVAEAEEFASGAATADRIEELTVKSEEDYRAFMGDTFEDALEEEGKTFADKAEEYDFVDESEEKESLFIAEAEDIPSEQKSEPPVEKDAPEIGKNLQ